MTNKDKYLKDGVRPKEIYIEFIKYCAKNSYEKGCSRFVDFMESEVKPTLTEDEKVILRKISKELKYIGRRGDEKHNFLYICEKPRQTNCYYALMLEDVFQFIKPRRRI